MSKQQKNRRICGDHLEVLPTIPKNSIDPTSDRRLWLHQRRIAVLLPKLTQPTTVLLARHLVDLTGVQPNAVASRALVDLNLLVASRFQRLTALRAPHMVSLLKRLLSLSFSLRLQLGEQLSFLLDEVFALLRIFSLIPLVRHDNLLRMHLII